MTGRFTAYQLVPDEYLAHYLCPRPIMMMAAEPSGAPRFACPGCCFCPYGGSSHIFPGSPYNYHINACASNAFPEAGTNETSKKIIKRGPGQPRIAFNVKLRVVKLHKEGKAPSEILKICKKAKIKIGRTSVYNILEAFRSGALKASSDSPPAGDGKNIVGGSQPRPYLQSGINGQASGSLASMEDAVDSNNIKLEKENV